MSTPKSLIQGVPKLTASNYSSWLKGVTGALRSQGPWRRINDIGLAPPDLSASIKYEIYLTALEKAAGIIYRLFPVRFSGLWRERKMTRRQC
jgi:hypothetical protein